MKEKYEGKENPERFPKNQWLSEMFHTSAWFWTTVVALIAYYGVSYYDYVKNMRP